MQSIRAILLGAALACGACVNPAPYTEALDAGVEPPLEPAERCTDEPAVMRLEASERALPVCRGTGLSAGTSCESQLSGWYALAYDLDVLYQDEAGDEEPAFEPGRGRLQLLFKAAVRDACPDADGGAESWLQLCELRLPALSSAADSGSYTLALSDAQPLLPAHFRAASLTGRPQLQQAAVRVLSGITPPLDNRWPTYADTPFLECGSARRGSACFPDDDADGAPGSSLQLTASGSNCEQGLPSEPGPLLPGRRVKALQLGLRTELQASMTFDPSCQTGTGPVSAHDVELRVLDCQLQSGAACTPLQAEHVDRHAPSFRVLREGEDPGARLVQPGAATLDLRPGRGGTLTARRLGTSSTEPSCQDVKYALEMSTP